MELLKCPFCGSDKLKVEHKNKFKDIRRNFIRMSFSVRCNSCHARGGIVTRDINYGKEAEEISKAKEKEEKIEVKKAEGKVVGKLEVDMNFPLPLADTSNLGISLNLKNSNKELIGKVDINDVTALQTILSGETE